MSQPAVGGLGFVIVISVWHAFLLFWLFLIPVLIPRL